jgi:hypothetical protein
VPGAARTAADGDGAAGAVRAEVASGSG